MCGRLTEYPHGFELDHKVALHQGGADTDENCQILCCGDEGCHLKKTKADMKGK
ncbi:TPA: HNH endonuclease [Serratia marcescens]|nr:HNH endonuclease [Pantoea endophytica]